MQLAIGEQIRSVPITALERAFDAHHAMVFRAAYKVTGNAADAEDVPRRPSITFGLANLGRCNPWKGNTCPVLKPSLTAIQLVSPPTHRHRQRLAGARFWTAAPSAGGAYARLRPVRAMWGVPQRQTRMCGSGPEQSRPST